MKIAENGNERSFIINNKRTIKVVLDEDGGIDFFDMDDPVHTGYYLYNIQEFYYFINGLTEIAKKIKDETCKEQQENY